MPWQQPSGQVRLPQVPETSQMPVAVLHVGFRVGQAVHAAPPVPHTVPVWLANGTQVLPWQQPVAQVPALQVPVTSQTPVPTLQVSFGAVHAVHAAPPVPQTAAVWLLNGTQVLPTQHPSAQLVESHTNGAQTPEAHTDPAPHGSQIAPPAPQMLPFWSEIRTQMSPLQQPAQLVLLHLGTGGGSIRVHSPPVQRVP